MFDGEMYSVEDLLNHTQKIYCPTREELEEYAKKYKDVFLYEDSLLLGPDRTTMYGYSSEYMDELIIPDEVEVYDNLCCHSGDETKSYSVRIGIHLKTITDTYQCFGPHVEYFSESVKWAKGGTATNPYFSVVDDMLFDKSESTLVMYPSGKTVIGDEPQTDWEMSFVTLPAGTKKICENAFQMLLLPETLVIPDSVEVLEEHAFVEFYDKGLYMTEKQVKDRSIILPQRFQGVIDGIWKEDAYERPNVMYY